MVPWAPAGFLVPQRTTADQYKAAQISRQGKETHLPEQCCTTASVELSMGLKVLRHFAPLLMDKHAMVMIDNLTAAEYISCLEIARSLLLWSHKHLHSIRMVYILGVHNQAADPMPRGGPSSEWRLSSTLVQILWDRVCRTEVNLLISQENACFGSP